MDLEKLTSLLAQRDAEITSLKAQLHMASSGPSKELGSLTALYEELD